MLIDAETIPYLDTTGAGALAEVAAELGEKGIVLGLACAKEVVNDMLDRTGV